MKTGKYERNTKPKMPIFSWIIVGILLVIITFLTFKLYNNSPTTIRKHETPETAPHVEKNPDSIAIPGYELLELRANSTTQTLCLPNPEQNVCYFQISLLLEDGTLLWTSELIAPGATSKPISLINPLDKGTYQNAILKYNCFKTDGITPLNGAETKLTLWVK